jgi:hypothetical protein
MERPSIHDLSTSTYEFNDPSMSSSNHELNPDFIDLVQDRPFFGPINEDPYIHLKEFKDLCSQLVIPGMTQKIVKWKLFPFSLMEKAEQWYAHTVGSVNSDWEELHDDFCNWFSLMERTEQRYHRIAWTFSSSSK